MKCPFLGGDMQYRFEACKRCLRHGKITLVTEQGGQTDFHFACKEHAFFFLRTLSERNEVKPRTVAKIRREIERSTIPSITRTSTKRLFHIDFVNTYAEGFSGMVLDDICLTIFLISPKSIKSDYKESVMREPRSALLH